MAKLELILMNLLSQTCIKMLINSSTSSFFSTLCLSEKPCSILIYEESKKSKSRKLYKINEHDISAMVCFMLLRKSRFLLLPFLQRNKICISLTSCFIYSLLYFSILSILYFSLVVHIREVINSLLCRRISLMKSIRKNNISPSVARCEFYDL